MRERKGSKGIGEEGKRKGGKGKGLSGGKKNGRGREGKERV